MFASQPDSAVVHVSWAPLRREPRHSAEMVNQVILGELVGIEACERPGWVSVRAPDGYAGFTTEGSLLAMAPATAVAWRDRATGISLGCRLVPATEGDSFRLFASHAPWGARLVVQADGVIELPGGIRVRPAEPSRIVPAVGLDRFAHQPEAVPQTAGLWTGAPYLWGGRTEQGTDCSGFVQAVYSIHGFSLPRDSRDQFQLASAPGSGESEGGRPGDLWFFAWEGGPVSHVGICLGDGRMLHASETRGCVAVDELGASDFGRRLAEGLVGVARLESYLTP